MNTKEEANLKDIIESLPGYIYWKNNLCEYIGCNKNLAQVSNLKNCDEIIGKKDEDFGWGEEQAESFRADDRLVMQAGTIKITEHTIPIVKNGQLTHMYVRTEKMPLRNKQGEIVGVLGVALDITELKEVQQCLKEEKEAAEIANTAKTEFLENMRHDIRTPMTGIIGCANLIKNSKNNPSKVEEYANILAESGEELLSFLTDVLDSVRINSGEIPILEKKFDLNLILKKIIRLNRPKAIDKGLQLKLDYDNSIPKYVIGDAKRIHRIVLELVTNALKYTNEGNVTISTKLAKRDQNNLIIKIIVEDTGMGIPADKQQDIFIQFTRLTPSFQGVYQGSGLGLALVKKFLKDLAAEIYVTSEVNKGSTFTCVIPLREALLSEEFGIDLDVEEPHSNVVRLPGLSNPFPNLEASSSSMGRILLVEDHNITSKITKEIISDFNYQVDIAVNGEAAIDLVNKHRYDIILMDIGLPDISGYEVTKQIRASKKNRTKPVIGLTAHVNIENKQYCLNVGMNAVFIKPLMKEKIDDIFDMFVPKHRELKENKLSQTKSDVRPPLHVLTGKVIDLELGIRLANGNKALANEFLNMLVSSFTEELKKMDIAYKARDWEAIKSILHKLRGGLSYCGVPRLREACARFDDYFKSGEKDLTGDLYQQFLSEFDKVKQEIEALRLSSGALVNNS